MRIILVFRSDCRHPVSINGNVHIHVFSKNGLGKMPQNFYYWRSNAGVTGHLSDYCNDDCQSGTWQLLSGICRD